MASSQQSVSVSISGLGTMESLIWNASGVMCTTAEQLSVLSEDPRMGAVVTKSCTLSPRLGNPSPRYYPSGPNGAPSINSMGLPNLGVDFYIDAAKRFTKPNKPVIISVAGLSTEENLSIIRKIREGGPESPPIELNLSCPNVPGKPQVGYDFESMDDVLRKVFDIQDGGVIGVKLPPYFDPIHFGYAADVIRKYPLNWVTCINSIGNGLIVDAISETTVIAPKGGLGGIGGSATVKAIALANVNSFRNLLPLSMDIIGCGGIIRGIDVFEHVLCGARAVQVGSLIQDHSLTAVSKLLQEFKKVMYVKGYKSPDEFCGKLKIIEEDAQLHSCDPSNYVVKSSDILYF